MQGEVAGPLIAEPGSRKKLKHRTRTTDTTVICSCMRRHALMAAAGSLQVGRCIFGASLPRPGAKECVVMCIRHAWAGLGLLLLAGCYAPVRSDVDRLICDSAHRPLDV